MKTRQGEYSSSDLINRTPKLKTIRDEIASWPSVREIDRGNARELLNLAAICMGLWESRRCGDDDPLSDLIDRFFHAAAVFGAEDILRVSGTGTVGDGILEREFENSVCARSAMAALQNHQRALEFLTDEYFGHPAEEWVSVATALVVDGLEGLKDWRDRDIVHPISYVRDRAAFIARDSECGGRVRPTDAMSREEDREVLSLDAPTPTGDTFAALLPCVSNREWDADVRTRVDIENVCRKTYLSKDAQLFALARYLGLPRDAVPEFLPLDRYKVEAARKRFERQLPQIQAGFAEYRKKKREKMSQKPA